MDVGIRGDVILIVPDEERVPNHRAVERDRRRRQENAENDIQVPAGEKRPRSQRCFWVRPLAGLGTGFRESLGAAHFVIPIVYSRRNTDEAQG